MKLLAFNNDAQLKADLMIELEKHRKADAIVKGTYEDQSSENFRGCAVGCSINSYNIVKGLTLYTSSHSNYELFGIPTLLARLEDSIFESLPSTHNIDWPINFMAAIKVGSDLSTVWPKFAQWLMTDKKHGVLQYAKTDLQKDIIQKISDLYRDAGSANDFKLAADDAYSATYAGYAAAAGSAAASAASYAYYAADAAADATNADAAAASSYAAAAASCAAYAAGSAKRFEVIIAQSEYLIKLLKECK